MASFVSNVFKQCFNTLLAILGWIFGRQVLLNMPPESGKMITNQLDTATTHNSKNEPDSVGPELMEMPLKVVEVIAKHCDYPTTECLRKTNKSLRQFFGTNARKTRMENISIRINHSSIEMDILLYSEFYHRFWNEPYPKGDLIRLEYEQIGFTTTKVSRNVFGGESVLLSKSSHFDAFFKDLNRILHQLKKPLKMLKINHYGMNPLAETTINHLKKLKSEIRVKEINIFPPCELLPIILPKLVPGTLERIKMKSDDDDLPEPYYIWPVDISEIVEMDQWKHAKQMATRYCMVQNPEPAFQHFLHFDWMDTEFSVFRLEDFVMLKDTLISHYPHRKSFHIDVHEVNEFYLLIRNRFGEHSFANNRALGWYFGIPRFLDMVLWMVFYDGRYLTPIFLRVNQLLPGDHHIID